MKRSCFECDGTGSMCNTCGEASDVCDGSCEEDAELSDCMCCDGTGSVETET